MNSKQLVEMENDRSQNILRILKGVGFAIISTLLLLLLFAILLTFTELSESSIPVTITCITAISILIASFLSCSAIHKSGLLNGGLIGAIYMFLIYVSSSITTTGFSINFMSGLMLVIGILCGMLGGIVAVNMRR